MDETAGATSLAAAVGGTAINLTGATAGADGQVDGTAVSFDGNDSGATAASLDLTAHNKLVVEALLYIPSYGTTSTKIVWEFGASIVSSLTSFSYFVDGGTAGGTTEANIAVHGNTNYNLALYPRTTAANWHHVAVVYDMSLSTNEVQIYVDGELQTASSRPFNGNNTNNFGNNILNLMARSGGSFFTTGTMQHLAIYSDLSSSDIASHASIALSPDLSAGTLSEDSHSDTTATLSWTNGSGGTAPITAQLQRSASGADSWSNVSGATTSPATDTGLTASTAYDYRVVYTDDVDATANSNTVTITLDATATAITLSGPTSGAIDSASTNFTVGSDGSVTGSVVVTPSDSGAGGTFSPTTVTLTTTDSDTFTYTPSSLGTKTISVTNNGSLDNPSSLDYESVGSGLVLGDSTIATYAGGTYVASFLYTDPQTDAGWTVTSIAVPGHTIAQQKTAYLAESSRSTVDYTIVQIGLNDLNPAEAASVAIARLQDLIDTINSNKKEGSLVLVSTMIPVKQRLIDLYGSTNGAISQQKFLDMNNAIKGLGATPITGADYRISNHTPLLDDGDGNLAAIYDTGDHVHENDAARQIIARVWRDSLAELEVLDPAVPSAPIIGTATAGDSTADITFSAPEFTGGATVTSYTVTSSPGSITASGGSSPITVSGLTNATAYTFTVVATNTVGNSSASSATSPATPSDATPPTITNITSTVANGIYTTGNIIDIQVTFSEAVTSTGNVTLTFDTGSTCTFSVSSSAAGSCNYTVQASDTSSDLTVSSVSGTIADEASNAMASFTPAANLAANKAIVINIVSTPSPPESNGGGGEDSAGFGSASVTFASSGGDEGDTSGDMTIAANTTFHVQIKAPDADQVHAVTMRIGGVVYTLALGGTDQNPEFIGQIPALQPGVYSYVISIDYGTTVTRNTGTIVVLAPLPQLAPAIVPIETLPPLTSSVSALYTAFTPDISVFSEDEIVPAEDTLPQPTPVITPRIITPTPRIIPSEASFGVRLFDFAQNVMNSIGRVINWIIATILSLFGYLAQ